LEAYTSQFAGHTVKLGGTWIHWTQPFVWSDVQRYNLDVIETPEANVDPSGIHAVVLVDGRLGTWANYKPGWFEKY
jgi:hypothetical protein